jgi:hypothetical protein
LAQSHTAAQEASAASVTASSTDTRPVISGTGAKYPTEAPTGRRHSARGILRSVRYSYSMVLTLSVDPSSKGPAVFLYRNDFTQIEFRALNFTPQGDLNPCSASEPD